MPEFNFGAEYDSSDFGAIDSGKYEVVIEKVETLTTKSSNKPMLKFTFKIRSDVDQNFKNRKLWYNIVKKDGDACYDFNKINKIIMTQDKFPTHFDTFDEVLQYLHNLNLRLEVVNEFSDYTGNEESRIKDYSFEKSLVPETTSDNATVAKSDAVTLPDDADLPF